jgi:cytochrome c-type biogenesis protein CcmH
MVAFLALAIVLMVAAVAAVVVPLLRTEGGSSPVAAVSAAILIPAAAILLYASVTTYSWLNRPGPTGGAGAAASSGMAGNAEGPAPSPPDLGPLRSATSERPNDAQAWLALGLGLVEAEQFKDAKEAFKRAESLGAPGSDARLGFAEAEILENPAMLDGEAGAIVEAIIKVDPANPKALWYGGMAAIRRGDNAAARSRWQALLAMSPPQPVRHVLEQQLARLDAPGGVPGTGAPLSGNQGGGAGGMAAGQAAAQSAPSSASAGNSAGLTLAITVDPALQTRVPAGAPLFVFARDPDRPGPPVAVVRHSASELPLTVALTDANMMVPGQSLSALGRVKLTARVSSRGDPIAAPGDVYGEVLWTRGQPTAPIRIVLNSVVGQP